MCCPVKQTEQCPAPPRPANTAAAVTMGVEAFFLHNLGKLLLGAAVGVAGYLVIPAAGRTVKQEAEHVGEEIIETFGEDLKKEVRKEVNKLGQKIVARDLPTTFQAIFSQYNCNHQL